ncbi:MAG: DUF5320 family protein [Dehalococcoidales bacterium]|nr:DUF5320 family protein [Dehalococcoidales bacterium]
MYGGFGKGRGAGGGAGGGQGFGFRGSSPPWPYVGRGRGGQPRCAYFTRNPATADTTPAAAASAAAMTREEELDYLKRQAQAVKGDLERINSRVRDLEIRNQGGSQ